MLLPDFLLLRQQGHAECQGVEGTDWSLLPLKRLVEKQRLSNISFSSLIPALFLESEQDLASFRTKL